MCYGFYSLDTDRLSHKILCFKILKFASICYNEGNCDGWGQYAHDSSSIWCNPWRLKTSSDTPNMLQHVLCNGGKKNLRYSSPNIFLHNRWDCFLDWYIQYLYVCHMFSNVISLSWEDFVQSSCCWRLKKKRCLTSLNIFQVLIREFCSSYLHRSVH